MSRIKNVAEVTAIPTESNAEIIKISSHWQCEEKVQIEIDGIRCTVYGKELKKAIKNCMNAGESKESNKGRKGL